MSRFQGERSRWVDVLIGLVVLLLLAGFAYMLLGNRQSTPPTAPTPQQAETSSEIPVAPGSETDSSGETGTNKEEVVETATEVEELPEDDSFEPPNEFDELEDEDVGLETEIAPAPVAVSPSEPPSTSAPTATAEPPQNSAAPQTSLRPSTRADNADSTGSDTGSASNGSATPPNRSARPRAGGAVPTSAGRVPTRSEYRISLGGFGSSAQAVQRTAAVAGIGYTVYSIDLGDQVVAQVGPFANAAQGQAALADIQRVYPAAALFAPKAGAIAPPQAAPVQSAPTQSAPTQSNPTQSAPTPASRSDTPPAARETQPATPQPKPQPAPKPQAKPQPTPKPQPAPQPTPQAQAATETYLQVGAFEDFEKAQELVEGLQGQGFSPSVNAPEGQMAKVLIGPFGPDELGAAEARLDASGYDHFRLR